MTTDNHDRNPGNEIKLVMTTTDDDDNNDNTPGNDNKLATTTWRQLLVMMTIFMIQAKLNHDESRGLLNRNDENIHDHTT